MTFERGQFVTLTMCGKTVQGIVMLASPNGRSLMVGFDGVLECDGGAFFGAVPLLDEEGDGSYRDLVGGQPVQVEPMREEPQ